MYVLKGVDPSVRGSEHDAAGGDIKRGSEAVEWSQQGGRAVRAQRWARQGR